MNNYYLNCEVLTPLFLGGANPRRDPPELRSPSFRGAIRFWYRALFGGSDLWQEDTLQKSLHKNEGDVFGTTETASALAIRITPVSISPEAFQKDRAIRTSKGDFLPTGKDYLFWSMASTGKPNTPRFQSPRAFIRPGTTFQVSLSNRLDIDMLNKGLAGFWLLSNLGAIGSRARRGAGSIQAIGRELPVSFQACNSIPDLQKYLHEGLKFCLQIMESNGWRNFPDNFIPEYETLHPKASTIWVVSGKSPWTSYSNALNGIGEILRDYRSHLGKLGKSDHDAVLNWFKHGGKEGPKLNRPVFGLPIPFRYSNGGPSDILISTENDRRGSPLHIRITRLLNGQYVGVLTLFKSKFLPDGASLRLQERKWKAPPPADFKIIEDFIDKFPVNEQVPL